MSTKSKTLRQLEKLIDGPLTISEIFLATRKSKELSQSEMAKLLGTTKQNICNIEKRRTFLSPELAAKYAKKLNETEKQFIRISLQDLLIRHNLHYEVHLEAA